jgi:hypothetical protein
MAVAGDLFPEWAHQAWFVEGLDTALATIRGLALLRFTDGEDVERSWVRAKKRLLASFAADREAMTR